MDKLKECARALLMMAIAVPLSVVAFVIVAWHLLTSEEAGYPYRGQDGDSD
jgi:ABC-type sulfate transport system permease subunit